MDNLEIARNLANKGNKNKHKLVKKATKTKAKSKSKQPKDTRKISGINKGDKYFKNSDKRIKLEVVYIDLDIRSIGMKYLSKYRIKGAPKSFDHLYYLEPDYVRNYFTKIE